MRGVGLDQFLPERAELVSDALADIARLSVTRQPVLTALSVGRRPQTRRRRELGLQNVSDRIALQTSTLQSHTTAAYVSYYMPPPQKRDNVTAQFLTFSHQVIQKLTTNEF